MSATGDRLLSGLVSMLAASFVQCRAATISANDLPPLIAVGNPVSAGGYTFLNFNGPNAENNAGTGTNMNSISNMGAAVGFDIDNNGGFHNFVANISGGNFAHANNPYGTANVLNVNGSTDGIRH